MNVKELGNNSFSYLQVDLEPGESIKTESGAMASMDAGIDLQPKLNGGIIGALLLKFLGKETAIISHFFNKSTKSQRLYLTQPLIGQIEVAALDNSSLYTQPGAFIACTEGVKLSLRWAGFSSWIAGEGLFRVEVSGTGKVWYGAFGAVVTKEVKGEYIVDSGHLLAYPQNIELKAKLSGGIFSSFFSGEGIVLKLTGNGTIKLQTRSIGGLAGWLNPRFWS